MVILPDGGHPAPVLSQVDPGPDGKYKAGNCDEQAGERIADAGRYNPLRHEVGRKPVYEKDADNDPGDPVMKNEACDNFRFTGNGSSTRR